MSVEINLNAMLTDHNVKVKFTQEARKDFTNYNQDTQGELKKHQGK